EAYARAVAKDRQRRQNGRLMLLAARRYLGDLKRSRSRKCAFRFDAGAAADICDFIEKLPHVEGKWETPTITLDPSQVWFLVNLVGFRDRTTGQRRFTRALLAVARKNAKSTLAAAILLYCLCGQDEAAAPLRPAPTPRSLARHL